MNDINKENLFEEKKFIFDENKLASVWRRFAAQILDQFLASFLYAILVFGVSKLLTYENISVFFVGIYFYLMYFLFNDGFPNGQSYGKYLMKIKVIDKTSGESCSYFQSLKRNFMSLIPIINILDALMIFSSQNQRFGDRIADTVVINAK